MGRGKGRLKMSLRGGRVCSSFHPGSYPQHPPLPPSPLLLSLSPILHLLCRLMGQEKKTYQLFITFFFLHSASLSVASFSICRSLLCQPHDDFVFKKRGPVTMKGKPEPMITYILQRKEGEWDCHYRKLKVLCQHPRGLTVKPFDFCWKRSFV